MNKKKQLLSAFLIAVATATNFAIQPPKVIAHRGIWTEPGSTQNSIRSLVKADSIGCYATEFDVWMTADSVMVVSHDGTVEGVNFTINPAEKVTALRLSNGEHTPTLEAMLDTAATLKIRLIVEVKDHQNRDRDYEAARQTVKLVNAKGLTDRVEYISYSKDATDELVRISGRPVYYLRGDYTPEELKEKGCTGADYQFRKLMEDTTFTARCHDLGLKVNVWTPVNTDEINFCIDNGVDFITTDNPRLAERLIRKKNPNAETYIKID